MSTEAAHASVNATVDEQNMPVALNAIRRRVPTPQTCESRVFVKNWSISSPDREGPRLASASGHLRKTGYVKDEKWSSMHVRL